MSDDLRLREAEEALRDALRVEPSKALVARVRADASAAQPRRVAVPLGAAAAVLVLASAAALNLLGSLRPRGLETKAAPASVSTPAGDAAQGPGPGGPSPVGPPTRAISPRPRPLRASLPSSPEIIVPSGQAEAMVRLVELTRSGVIAPPRGLVDPPDPSASVSEPASVRIEPLTIAPLEAAASPAADSPLGRGDF